MEQRHNEFTGVPQAIGLVGQNSDGTVIHPGWEACAKKRTDVGVRLLGRDPELQCAPTEIGAAMRLFAAFVDGRSLVECSEQLFRGVRDWLRSFEDDILGAHFLTIQIFVCAIVSAESRAVEGDASEETTGTRIRKNFRAHGDISFGGGGASHGSSGCGNVAAEFDLALQNTVCRARRHQEQHEVGRVAAELQAGTAALERHHGRSAPFATKVLALTAGHNAATIAATDTYGEF